MPNRWPKHLCLLVVVVALCSGYCLAHAPKDKHISLSRHDLERHHHNRSRLIVVARYNEDTSWLEEVDTEHVIMQLDPMFRHTANSTGHLTLSSKGREAMAYLQFIIDFYELLPESIAFVHGHRSSWHMLDVVPRCCSGLRWGEHGFANLRYGPTEEVDWMCGPGDARLPCNWTGGVIRPGDLEYYIEADPDPLDPAGLQIRCSLNLAEMWDDVLAEELGSVPARLYAPCCANFMVSRGCILTHSKAFYVRLRDWLLDTPIHDYSASIVFEYLWHRLFGMPNEIEPVDKCSLLLCDEP